MPTTSSCLPDVGRCEPGWVGSQLQGLRGVVIAADPMANKISASGPKTEIDQPIDSVMFDRLPLTASKSPNSSFRPQTKEIHRHFKTLFEMGVWKFESFQVSQAVRQLEIVISEILEMPANCGLLQIGAPSPSSQFGQSQSEIADSLWRIFEIFPFLGDSDAETRFDLHCAVGTAVARLKMPGN
jgi:hypothetical protein